MLERFNVGKQVEQFTKKQLKTKQMCYLQQILHHLSALLSLMLVAPRVSTYCCPSKSTHHSDDSNVQNGPTSSPLHNLSSQYEMDTLNDKSKRINPKTFPKWLVLYGLEGVFCIQQRLHGNSESYINTLYCEISKPEKDEVTRLIGCLV